MSPAVPVYECRRVPRGCIRIDGDLSDTAWAVAPWIENFVLSDGSGPAQRKTSARMAWDEDYLYICFKAEDPDIWGTYFNRDDPIYQEEVVEAFIDPDSDLGRYYEFQQSPHGTLFDAIIDNPTHDRREFAAHSDWNCDGWLAAVRVDGTLDDRSDIDRVWTAEWAIPFASLETAPNVPPKDGDAWRINLYRIDRTPVEEYSCWSPTMKVPADFHQSERFGVIVFRE